MSADNSPSWESWNVADFINHKERMVEVRRVGEERILLRGRVFEFTDLVGGPGIVEYGE